MCGISGFLNINKEPASLNILKKMTNCLAHRGPDGKGFFIYKNFGLGHRRLSIIDLSKNSNQPMISEDKNWVVSYNGEIYNFKEIREDLKKRGYSFISSGDTEVILKSFIEWGEGCLQKFNGMFAICIFNKKKKEFFLCRDRFGIKPLYYFKNKDYFLFSSEIKSFLFYPKFKLKIDNDCLGEYLIFQNFLSNETICKDVKILEPGTSLNVSMSGKTKQKKFWDLKFINDSKENFDYKESKNELIKIVEKSVKSHLISDVPVSTLLSGGIDSGTITSIAKKHIKNLKTFTIGFNMESVSGIEIFYDERSKAEKLSAELGTEHYELVLKSGDMEKAMDKIVWHLEEPRVGQCYPNYYAAKLASGFNKVILTGTGGDELFAGYPWRYYRNKKSKNIDDYILNYYNFWNRLLKEDELEKIQNTNIKNKNFYEKFRGILDINTEKENSHEEFINYSLKFEIKTFLHGLLIVEDKLSMAHSLETRVPFLDNDLSNFALEIPLNMKLKNLNKNVYLDENISKNKRDIYFENFNDGKLILRDAMTDYLPKQVLESKKQGFSGPDNSWFKGKSINFVKENLMDKNQKIYNHLDFKFVNEKVNDHIVGKRNNRLLIWSFLYLNYFFKKFT